MSEPPDTRGSAVRPLTAMTDRFGALFGVSAQRRHDVLAAMVRAIHDRADRAGYWFQLALAMGIATLGLVLDSTGVVIGAMLVAPLMGPIVHLAMGLVIGSSVLVLHAAVRVIASVVAVIGGACALTLLLPFQETTREIAARGSPTALDLGVAAFCALAGGFSTIRPGADTAATAAGTSIGISLVPPLCVVGFAIGTGATPLAEGAGLLFVTNLTAILFFCALYFALLGFRGSDSDPPTLDRASGPVDLAARGARSLLGRDYGVLMRVGLPLILLAVVFVPLRRALSTVTWEVRTRGVVRALLNEAIPAGTAVQSHLDVAGGRITVRVVMVDHGRRAQTARDELARKIERATRVVPEVEVVGVPDLQELRDVAESLRHDTIAPEATRRPDLDGVRRRVEQVLTERWPTPEAGRLAQWRLEVQRGGRVSVVVRHEGAALGAAAVAMLSRDVSAALGTTTTIRDVALGESAASAAGDGLAGFVAKLAAMVEALREDPALRMCVARPATPADVGASTDAGAPADGEVRAVIDALLRRVDVSRVRVDDGDGWRASLTFEQCPVVAHPSGADAGAVTPRDADADVRPGDR